MLILKLYFFVMPVLVNFSDTSKNTFVVIGEAYNEKDGAWVLSKTGKENYFLEGIEQWDEKIVGKKVKVWGRLLIEKLEKAPSSVSPAPGVPPPPIPQQLIGLEKRTILKAKWKLIR
ncbi:MAG: hypothetical protein V4685_09610 [Bacteroidota bacterium]